MPQTIVTPPALPSNLRSLAKRNSDLAQKLGEVQPRPEVTFVQSRQGVAAGACILEQHITYDRKVKGLGHAMSLEPAQFEGYVRLARRAHAMLGRSSKQVIPIEQEVRQASRQSIVATRTLKSGHVIARPDLTIKRPGTGIEPRRIDEVDGQRLRRTVEVDSPIVESDLEVVSINDAEDVAPLGTLTSN